MATVRCPRCGVKQKRKDDPDAVYYCSRCRGMFDNDPDEGGDYHADPSRRMERSESRCRGPGRGGAPQ